MNLMAPGDFIVPTKPLLHSFGEGKTLEVGERPYLCEAIFGTPKVICSSCGPVETGLTVKEFPGRTFCVVHWRPIYRPPLGFEWLTAAPGPELDIYNRPPSSPVKAQ